MARHTIFSGLRGVGKTVLLTKIEKLIEDSESILYEHIECDRSSKFSKDITIAVKKIVNKLSILAKSKDAIKNTFAILKAFTLTWNPTENTLALGMSGETALGTADTGDLSNDLTELFISVGEIAKKNRKCICFILDEIQDLQKNELSALIRATHRINQLQLPIIIIGAGIPTILRISGEAKSYSERLFNFIEITSLKNDDAVSALVEPAKSQNVNYTKDAFEAVVERTGGYPFFIQEYGQCVWNYISDDVIDIDGVNSSYPEYLSKLDDSFFKVRYNRTTPKEKEFLFAMEKCNSYPCQMSQVASYMNQKPRSISLFRNNLINKGLIYAPSHGEVDFTVPQFDSYLKRVK
ncbi:hypothetical protein UF75_4455 [Desulfosporosinus sp. I2]|nr:hypothetical protein UF75_4455 [Desulfosporosinus sp. I2]